MSDTDQLRYETENGISQVEFYRTLMEECRVKMLECRHRFWMKSGAPLAEWRPIRDEYWTALDNWQASIVDLMEAKKNVHS